MSSDESDRSSDGESWAEEGSDEAQDVQASGMQHSNQHIQDHRVQVSHVPGDATSGGDNAYDPESRGPAGPASAVAARSPSAQTASKPKTMGGFIVSDDEDDDDDADLAPVAVRNPAGQGLPGRSSSLQVPQPHLSSASQVTGPSVGPVGAVNPPVASTATMSLPDPVNALEERVKQDPRGDVDAWLALIAEYTRRGRAPEIRSAYDRFLEIFRAAVSLGQNAARPLRESVLI